MNRPRLGVSACLAGQRVRYDGGDKLDRRLVRLGQHLELVEVCPEAELGLGVPRPPMHLEVRDGEIELVISDSGQPIGERMRQFGQERVSGLHGLDGYVFKSKSPSCAVDSAPHGGGHGPGLFAQCFTARWPTVPVVEESGVTRHFVRRVFATSRLRQLFRPGWSTGALVAFHTAHKLLLFSCDPGKTRELGAFVASSATLDAADAVLGYRRAFAEILARAPTRGREIDTLQHCVGYFDASSAERERAARLVQALIDDSDADVEVARQRMAAMIAAADIDYLVGQHYFVTGDRERAALEAL